MTQFLWFLIKMVHFIPCYKTLEASKIAKLILTRSSNYMVFLGPSCLIGTLGS